MAVGAKRRVLNRRTGEQMKKAIFTFRVFLGAAAAFTQSPRVLLAIAAVLSGSTTVVAQSPDAADSQPAVLSEVVVTAQKRSESLEKVPMAVTALGTQALEDRNITNVSDVAAFTPNLQIARAGNSSGGAVYIRGVGQSDAIASADPGVGIYLDGVYLARGATGSLFDLIDIQRIEVLRGPQGTLYGKSTIGGAINVISKEPTDELSGWVRGGGGNYDERMYGAGFNVALAPNLFARGSVLRETRDGFTRDSNTGLGVDDREDTSGRLQLRYLPTDSLDVQLSGDISHKDDGQSAIRRVIAGPTIAQGNPDPFTGAYYYDGYIDGDYSGVTAHVRWTGAAVSIVSITGYRDIDELNQHQLDGGPNPVILQYSSLEQHELSQEIQLLGSSFGGELRWITGIYAFRERIDYLELDNIRHPELPTVSNADVSLVLLPTNTTYAVFGQADWKPTDRLTFTGGLRESREHREVSTHFNAFEDQGTKSWSKITPRVSVAYQVTESALAYVTAAEGFKAGQFNARAQTASQFRCSILKKCGRTSLV